MAQERVPRANGEAVAPATTVNTTTKGANGKQTDAAANRPTTDAGQTVIEKEQEGAKTDVTMNTATKGANGEAVRSASAMNTTSAAATTIATQASAKVNVL